VGRIFFPKIDHITKIGKEVVGIIFFSKSSLNRRDRKGGCGENFFSKSRLEASRFMKLSTNDFFSFSSKNCQMSNFYFKMAKFGCFFNF